MGDRKFHTMSYSITGDEGKDKVYRIPDRIYRQSRHVIYGRHVTPSDGARCLEFCESQLGKPFDMLQFYFSNTFLRVTRLLLPETWTLKGACYRRDGDYKQHSGGWTCSSFTLAATQTLGLMPNEAPCYATPGKLSYACRDHPSWSVDEHCTIWLPPEFDV